MKILNLYNHNLTELSESDLIALCHLNNFKPEELTNLNLSENKLTDLDFITENTPFVNLTELKIGYNKMMNIENIKYLINLVYLDIRNLYISNEKNAIYIIKQMRYLKEIDIYNTFMNYNEKDLEKELSGIIIYN